MINDFPYFIVFYTIDKSKLNIYHIIGTEEKSSDAELPQFIDEVRNDDEFGLGDFVDELSIKILTYDEIEPILNDIGCNHD